MLNRKLVSGQRLSELAASKTRMPIASKLDAFSLKEIAAATRLSLAACSRIRAGAQMPHPRHWDALLALVGGA